MNLMLFARFGWISHVSRVPEGKVCAPAHASKKLLSEGDVRWQTCRRPTENAVGAFIREIKIQFGTCFCGT